MKTFKLFIFVFLFVLSSTAQAHTPVLEPLDDANFKYQGLYLGAVPLEDPTSKSLAVYGTISDSEEYDLYVFVPKEDGNVPVELLVPVRNRNAEFKPTLIIMAQNLSDSSEVDTPFEIPEGYKAKEVKNEDRSKKFLEPYSAERYYEGHEFMLPVQKEQNYFVAIYDPNKQAGDYVLSAGTKENFSDESKIGLLRNVLLIKTGLLSNVVIPWIDLLGLFLLLAGFVIGLGAVTVIDVHGFLARHSNYWTLATIRAHKITKPLIWLGTFLVVLGGIIFYRENWLNGVVLFQAVLILILIFNGLFLTFYISPKLIEKEKSNKADEPLPHDIRNIIAVSFLISFVGWWGSLIALCWYLLVQR